MFLHFIADYGINDLAFNEVITRLRHYGKKVDVYPISVPPFSTIATGFLINQLSLFPAQEMGIYCNTAPRKDELNARPRNGGEPFVYARLKNGIPVMTVNSGFSLSFVKDRIESFHRVTVSNEGSQFRSRDNFPQTVIGIMEGDESLIGEELDINDIPDIPQNRVAWIDGYGNMKTTIRLSEVKLNAGDQVKIVINTTIRQATFAPGTFEVNEGELAFAPGSSGGEDKFMELFLRGSSARRSFNKARVGQEVDFELYNGH